MDITSLIISLISGLVGGNIAGAAMTDKNPGAVTNSISGLIGGGLGDFLLKALGVLGGAATTGAASGIDLSNIPALLGNIGGTGVSGAILTIIVALVKAYVAPKA